MRISSNTLFERSSSQISDQQSSLSRLQQQISTGLRIQSPSDDPLGASRVLTLKQGQAINTQNASNRTSAKNALEQQEGTLGSISSVLQDVKDQVIAANNGSFDDVDRKILATELRVRLQDLTGLANSRDNVGNYLFAGFQDGAQPFNGSGAATSYAGDSGSKQLQVSDGRQMAVNESGDAVFMNVPAKMQYASTATGGASMTSVQVTDASKAKPGHQYDVVFDGSAGYKVFDTTMDPNKSGTPAASGAYANPTTVTVDGLEMKLAGAPAAGDAVSVKPVRNQSMFKTIGDLIDTLEKPIASDADRKDLVYNLGVAGENMSSAINHILSVRASGGAKLQELDSLDAAGGVRDVQYSAQLSDIQEVDMVKAISEFTQKQQNLQAAQQSFVKASGLSLFNYL